MWSGVVPFLIHWLALSTQRAGYSPQPPKSHWNLLSDFQALPEDDIEEFLPQICNILVAQDASPNDEYGIYSHFGKILMEKCAGCLPFGLRVCSLLKSAQQSDLAAQNTGSGTEGLLSGGLFKSVLGSAQPSPDARQRAMRLHYLVQGAEEATSHGLRLPQRVGYLRAKYYHDLNVMLDTMVRTSPSSFDIALPLTSLSHPSQTCHPPPHTHTKRRAWAAISSSSPWTAAQATYGTPWPS